MLVSAQRVPTKVAVQRVQVHDETSLVNITTRFLVSEGAECALVRVIRGVVREEENKKETLLEELCV